MNRDADRGSCGEWEALLEDFLDGALSRHAADQVSAHLGRCAVCREALDAARGSVHLLRAGCEPTQDPGPVFARRVMALIRDEEARGSRFLKPLESLAWRLALSASLVVTLLIGYGLRPRIGTQTAITSARQARSEEIFPDPDQQPANRDEVLVEIAQTNHGK
jgi:predicted anti-sigma-YlaC factor YlaD